VATLKTLCGGAGSSGVLSLRPQRNGDDSSGWKVKGVSMEPYVVAPAALVRVCSAMQKLDTSCLLSCQLSAPL
jgi:hypothetical protein